MFTEIKALLDQHDRLSLRELASHFSMTPEAMEPMLHILVRKKQVRIYLGNCGTSCDGCTCSSGADGVVYERIKEDA
jgi:methionine synthase I (cobalamin-dependent)